MASVSRRSWAMGSEVAVTALHPRQAVAEQAVAEAIAAVASLEDLLSLYRPESQLCRLNRDGVLRNPHPDLVEVLRNAEAMSRRTGGAFDVTVQPLWRLYAAAGREGGEPEARDIEAARRKVDWRRVAVTERQIEFFGRDAEVTLNGIAQGFAADRAMAVLQRCGVRNALVNTGEIGTLDGKSPGEDWTVGIRHPRDTETHVGLARLSGRCLATSGDYATAFSEDYRLNHVFDPRTGRSPEAFSSVTVAAPTACRADALSTAVFVLGPERGLQLVRATPGADVLLIFKDGRTLATQGFPGEVG
jgi:thiamine biosynthesis lipoprotein